jgi:nitroreductase
MMEIKPENAKRLKAYQWYYGRIVPLLYGSEPTHLFSLSKKLAALVIGIFRPIAREVSQTDMRIVAHKSAALAAQTFMLSMKAEGYDTCPMEGMDSKRIKNALKLPAKAEISMVICMGKGIEKGIYGPRWRLPLTDVVFEH